MTSDYKQNSGLMDQQGIKTLLRKILAGEASDAERHEIEEWYAEQNNQDVVWEAESPDEEQQLEEAMRTHIFKHIEHPSTPGRVFRLPLRARVAAAVSFFFLTASGYYLLTQKKTSIQETGAIESQASRFVNKYVLLPDGSHLLLHPGSKISYDFSGKTREVNLTGEAYFDVKHEREHPFVIHTGAVTTTVLGTAFDIKAYAGQKVVVTVTRGKVSVSNAAKSVTAVLTPNQQVEYDEQKQSVKKEAVNSEKEVTWMKADMKFDELAFSALADRLSQRYGMVFEFKNPALKNYPITGRFSGDESLDEVLKIISQTTSTTYSINGNKVIIDGKCCSPITK